MRICTRFGWNHSVVGLLAFVMTAPALAGNPKEVTVDCSKGKSIADAIDKHAKPARLLIVTVEGTCTEDIEIIADDVIVQGTSAGGPPVDTLVGSFTIRSARRVTIKDLVVRDSTLSFPLGIFVTETAAATLENLDVTGHAIAGSGGTGIGISRNSFAQITNVRVDNPADGNNAVFLNDGAYARIRDSEFTSANPGPFDGAALGLFRNAGARLDGTNVITNTGTLPIPAFNRGSVNQAIDLTSNSDLRIQPSGAQDQITGNVRFGIGTGSLRNVNIAGLLELARATVEMFAGSNVTGDIDVHNVSHLSGFGLTVGGAVNCITSLDSVNDAALVATGGISATCSLVD